MTCAMIKSIHFFPIFLTCPQIKILKLTLMENRLVRNMNKFENQIDQNSNIFNQFLLYSSVVDLQCYAHFCCMAK